MTEFNDEVEYQRKKLAADQWGEQIQHILGQDGYVEVAYNNNRIERTHHRGPKEGTFEVIQPAWSPDEVMMQFIE
jgi:hypothetical protein